MKHTLKKSTKHKKEEVVEVWNELFNKYANVIYVAGIKQESINKYIKEPWDINNIRRAIKWFIQYFEPELLEFVVLVNEFKPSGWTLLKTQKNPKFQQLIKQKNKVIHIWACRPRFKDDIGRTKKGY